MGENASAFTRATMKYSCKITTSLLFLSENTVCVYYTFSDPLLMECCRVIVGLSLVELCETVSTSSQICFPSSESSRE